MMCPRCNSWMIKPYAKGVCTRCYCETDGCCKDYTKDEE